jgi:hypothetical protein
MSNITKGLIQTTERAIGHLIRGEYHRVITALPSTSPHLTTMQRNTLALTRLGQGNYRDALSLQTLVVSDFVGQLGSTHDAYVDIGGAISDLAVMFLLSKDYVNAEKQLKRALLMTERSYRVDQHLRLSLHCNLMQVYRAQDRKEEALNQADVLFKSLGGYKPLPIVQSLSTYPCMYSKYILPYIHIPAFHFALGRVNGHYRTPEEGLIHVNTGFRHLLDIPNLAENGRLSLLGGLISLRDINQNALMRGRSIKTSHIAVDHLKALLANEGQLLRHLLSDIGENEIRIELDSKPDALDPIITKMSGSSDSGEDGRVESYASSAGYIVGNALRDLESYA